MRIHEFRTELWLPRPSEEVFEFFADPANLDAITPNWLSFPTITPGPIDMRVGAMLDYKLRIRGIPIRWRSKITAWEPPYRFVDEQVRGPYRGLDSRARIRTEQPRDACARQRSLRRSFRFALSQTAGPTGRETHFRLPGEMPASAIRLIKRRECDFYCARNAIIGSTFVARSAGI